jgi:hypothetical protein
MGLQSCLQIRGNYTIAAEPAGSEKYCVDRGEFVMNAKLFCGLYEGDVSDAASEEVAANDVACGIAAENDGSAERALEFVENGWFEDGGFLPIGGQRELAVLYHKTVGGLEFGAGVFACILCEIFRGSLEGFIPFKDLRRSVFKTQGETHTGIWFAVKSDFRAGRGDEVGRVARFEKSAEPSNALL